MKLDYYEPQYRVSSGVIYETRIACSRSVSNRLTALVLQSTRVAGSLEHYRALSEALESAQVQLSKSINYGVRTKTVCITTGEFTDEITVICGIRDAQPGLTKRLHGVGFMLTVRSDEKEEVIRQTFGKKVSIEEIA